MKVNIEGDELLYRAAFSVEKQGYILYLKIPDRDGISEASQNLGNMYTASQIHARMKEKGVTKERYRLEGYKYLVPDDELSLGCALALVRKWITAASSYVKDGANIWISPSNGSNFRNKVATTPRIVNGVPLLGYKAGRARRPMHYEAIREFLISEYNAVEIDGYEADDALGMHRGLMCHIDKDINMVPGHHYHWVDDRLYSVKEGIQPIAFEKGKLIAHGLIFFYIQLLMGDSTDNIPGLQNLNSTKKQNFGPKSVYELLRNCKDEPAALAIVKELYYNVYKSEWKDKLFEIADLVWIVQDEGITGSRYLECLM